MCTASEWHQKLSTVHPSTAAVGYAIHQVVNSIALVVQVAPKVLGQEVQVEVGEQVEVVQVVVVGEQLEEVVQVVVVGEQLEDVVEVEEQLWDVVQIRNQAVWEENLALEVWLSTKLGSALFQLAMASLNQDHQKKTLDIPLMC